jgi:phosphotransferase system enzyme I (PtsP)
MREPAGGLTPFRRLLRRLRDIMAADLPAEQRLQQTVSLIAADMVAEVCSVYVMRAGEVLELFATHGLRREAIHKTRLRVGEGLVGDIAAHARPLALSDAQSHPNFAYRPETGEEIYHSLMGVPILRGGRVLGVLVVQNRTRRHYTDDDVEALQTIAMVLAELVASGELVSPEERRPSEGTGLLPIRLEGLALNSGIAIGVAVLHEPGVVLTRIVAEDPEAELDRLRKAVLGMQTALDDLIASADLAQGEERDILETYRMFAQDRGWITRITEAIRSGLTAEAAVQKVKDDTRARLSQAMDPYLRERLSDLDDLANRLIEHLTGSETRPKRARAPDGAILVARSLGPAELLDYGRRRIKGLVLEEGSPTAHVAIVARALGIPVLGRVANALVKVEAGDSLILDADHEQAFLRPREDLLAAYQQTLSDRERKQRAFALTRDLPPVTRDGVRLSLNINAGLLIDLRQVAETGADGVGLYRTEIPFMVRSSFPDVSSQAELYRRVLDGANGCPVTFRTLDIGGDKALPYWHEEGDENPAMGWRAIRIGLDRPALLRQQLRAMIRAAAGRPLSLMFPLIAQVSEFERARAVLELELERAAGRGEPLPERLSIGVMLEVPALLWQLPALLRKVDFVSVGTNDLQQFLFASDRGNPRLAHRYDMLAPAMLKILAGIADAAEAAGVSAAVCGEMAGQPLEAMALAAVGFRSLSMAPPAIGPVRAMARSLELGKARTFMRSLLDSPEASLRARLQSYALDHEIAA